MGLRAFIRSLPCFGADARIARTQTTQQTKYGKEIIHQRRASARNGISQPPVDWRHQEERVSTKEARDYNNRSAPLNPPRLTSSSRISPPMAARRPVAKSSDRRTPLPSAETPATRATKSSLAKEESVLGHRKLTPPPPAYESSVHQSHAFRPGRYHSPRPPPQTDLLQPQLATQPSSKKPMDPVSVSDVVAYIELLLGEHHYAVFGLSAMVHYGFAGRKPTKVNVVCPLNVTSKIEAYVSTNIMTKVKGQPNTYGIRLFGDILHINFEFLSLSDFETLDVVRTGKVWAFSLPAIADWIAGNYIKELSNASSQRQEMFKEDMTWCLQRMMAETTPGLHEFSASNVGALVSSRFCIPFLASFEGMYGLFRMAGLDIKRDEFGQSNVVRYILSPPENKDPRPINDQIRFDEVPRPSQHGEPIQARRSYTRGGNKPSRAHHSYPQRSASVRAYREPWEASKPQPRPSRIPQPNEGARRQQRLGRRYAVTELADCAS